MALGDGWVEVTPSQFPHETEGLNYLRNLLPDEPPFHAWSNFEFRDSHGKWHEIDAVVLGRRRMHLVELKYYSGVLRGDDHVWRREGHYAEDSPLKLARRKAQRLASRLTDELRLWAQQTNTSIPDARDVVPFVQESVFLHHDRFTCLLSDAAKQDLFGPDGHTDETNLPGITDRLLESAGSRKRDSISTTRADIIALLMQRIGAVQRRQREAGSWIIDEEPLAEGDNWQDWPAFHHVTQDRKARIRFYVNGPGRSEGEQHTTKLVAEHEFRTTQVLKHDGIIVPNDVVDTELGTGLVYEGEEGYQRLDLWLADHPGHLPILGQVELIRQVGQALKYAHQHRVVHRGLNPSAILVRQRGGQHQARSRPARQRSGGPSVVPPKKPRYDASLGVGSLQAAIGNWQVAGLAPTSTALNGTATATASPVTRLASASPTAMAQFVASSEADGAFSPAAFRAPEDLWAAESDRIRLDVFSLGALAYYILTGKAPASSNAALRERLARDGGLDIAADLPQAASRLREMVLQATRPTVSERTATVAEFLGNLADAERVLAEPDRDDHADPLEARPGTEFVDRFRLVQELGTGSTARGLLVTDLAVERSGKGDARRVLKVALDDRAAQRLIDEAEVLRSIDNRRIARLVEGPITIGSRTALVLQFAGTQTLADLLATRTRLSLDLLERYGGELLEALVALDASGVDHRDIKPANLGVMEDSRKSKHLMLFDFSLSRAAASAIEAGTRGYLDPFLGTEARPHYDSAAERYAAAVVLFEMATGSLPTYGDGTSDPLSSGGQLQLDEVNFDPAVATPLQMFFSRALAPKCAERPHTAGQLAAEWAAIFAPVSRTQPDNADEIVGGAERSTRLAEAGLSARALSALEPFGAETVGDVVAIDPVRLNRLPGAAEATRKEVKSRAKQWRDRLGAGTRDGATTAADPDFPSLTVAAEMLLDALDAAPKTQLAQAARALLGLRDGKDEQPIDIDAFIPETALGPKLGVAKKRGSKLIRDLHTRWAENQVSSQLLNGLRDTVLVSLVESAGVATIGELAEAIRAVLPGPVTASPEEQRLSEGLLRVVLDRISALQRAEAIDQEVHRLRDRSGRVLAVSLRADLLTAATSLGRRADELVQSALAADTPIVAASRAAAVLRETFDAAVAETPEPELDPAATSNSSSDILGEAASDTEQQTSGEIGSDIGSDMGDARLVRLAAAMSQHAAEAGDGSLHSTDLALDQALKLTMGGVAPAIEIEPGELATRVQARFPALPKLPKRSSGLEELISRAGLDWVYDESRGVYRTPVYRSDTTGLATRLSLPPLPIGSGTDAQVARRLHHSVSASSFLALGVPAPHMATAIRALYEQYQADTVDVTAVLIEAMRSQAAVRKIPWETVRAADAAEPGSRDARGLAALVTQALPAIDDAIRAATQNGTPALLTEAAPLARYGHMDRLAHWTDLTTPRSQAVWLLVPQLHGASGASLDRMPLPLAAPGQFVQLDDEWLAMASSAQQQTQQQTQQKTTQV